MSQNTLSLAGRGRPTSRLGAGRFRVAGTAEFNGYNHDIRDVRVNPLIAWTRQLFPAVSTERVVPWAGLRPMTPSMLPRVGAGRKPCVFYNTGHGHLGWTLSAATATIIANTVETHLRATIPPRAASLYPRRGSKFINRRLDGRLNLMGGRDRSRVRSWNELCVGSGAALNLGERSAHRRQVARIDIQRNARLGSVVLIQDIPRWFPCSPAGFLSKYWTCGR
jgi:hypothetical protein